jgi:Na+-driven multidrug efflux pump
MVFCSIYFLLDVWIWLAQGVLTAFRDTRFYLLVKVPGIWLGAIVPTAWWVSSSHNSLETMWLFMLGAPLVMLPIFMLRIRNILRRKLQLK